MRINREPKGYIVTDFTPDEFNMVKKSPTNIDILQVNDNFVAFLGYFNQESSALRKEKEIVSMLNPSNTVTKVFRETQNGNSRHRFTTSS